MRTGDSPKLDIIGTAGLSSASQLFNLTGLPAASGAMNLTATPDAFRVRLRIGPKLANAPVASEATWQRLASVERKKAKKKGSKPSDVTKAVAASRYRR